MAVKEKGVSVKPSEIDFVEDGMIVRFAYHNPVKFFFNLARLYTFILAYEKELAKPAEERQANYNKFFAKKFNFVMMTSNKAKLVLEQSVCGHKDMSLPKDAFIETIEEMFEP